MVAKKRNYKLDIFGLLDNINLKNHDFYNNLPEEQRKEVHPLVVMRWLTGCGYKESNPAMQLYLLNEYTNPFVFLLSKHPNLLLHLMMISSSGKAFRYKFISKINKRGSKYPKTSEIIKSIFHYNSGDAQEAIEILDKKTIISMAEGLGYQDNEIKVIKKELKKKPA